MCFVRVTTIRRLKGSWHVLARPIASYPSASWCKKVLSISTGDEIGKLAYGTGTIPFIRTSDISNWELKADPKHGVSREIYESLRDKQDVQAGDILMVKDGTYLIGTCAIVSEADREMLCQSHLYKIRVNKNSYGLNPYLLSSIVKFSYNATTGKIEAVYSKSSSIA